MGRRLASQDSGSASACSDWRGRAAAGVRAQERQKTSTAYFGRLIQMKIAVLLHEPDGNAEQRRQMPRRKNFLFSPVGDNPSLLQEH